MALTQLPDPPQTSDPANFATKADALVAALATMVTEINGGAIEFNGGTLTTSPLDATPSTFNLLATPTTINAFAGASVALNIGNASAAAAFLGGISIPTGKTLSGAGAVSLTGTITTSDSVAFGTTVSATARLNIVNTGAGNSAVTLRSDHSPSAVSNIWNADAAGDNVFATFFIDAGATLKGAIDYNRGGGAVRYNTTSDANLKTLIGDAPLKKSVDILKSTRLREFYWDEDATKKPQIAPFAQELYKTYKGAVSVGGDDPSAKGYRPWGVDKTAFSFHLVGGWQDHEARLAALEAK